MAIATRPKPRGATHKKRVAQHHRQDKHYLKAYWPYLPMLAIIGLGLVLNDLWSSRGAVLGASVNLSSQALLSDTNSQRTADHEAALSLNDKLNRAAQAKADDMVKRDYWSHVTPTGLQPWAFIAAAGYQYQAAGENLAYGFASASQVLSGWMHSPEHRANILDSAYQNVGFGVATSTNYLGTGPETVVVAMYGQPAGQTASLPALNAPGAGDVDRLQLVSNTAPATVTVLAVIGSCALVAVLLRHGLAWRRLLVRGEYFVVSHPGFDIALVAVATLILLLNHSVGFIH